MAEKFDPKEVSRFEEVLVRNVCTQKALINLLWGEGLVLDDNCFWKIGEINCEWDGKEP